MSVANDALLVNLGLNQFPVVDDLVTAATTQATATRCLGQVNRFVKVASTATAVLPSLLSLEAPTIIFIINDGANTLVLWPFGTETINGANAVLSGGIPAGQSAICIAVVAAKTAKGGGIAPGSFANDWRVVAIP